MYRLSRPNRLLVTPRPLRQELRYPVYHIAHGANALRGFIRNIDVELTFHREQDVNPIEGVDTELRERAVGCDLLLRQVLRRRDNSSDSLGQFFVGHRISVTLSKWKPRSINFGRTSRSASRVTRISGRDSSRRPSCKQKIAPFRAPSRMRGATRSDGHFQSSASVVHITPIRPSLRCASRSPNQRAPYGARKSRGRTPVTR